MEDDDAPIWVDAHVEDTGQDIKLRIRRSKTIEKLKKIAMKEIIRLDW